VEVIIIGGLLVGAVFASLGAWISAQKGRSPAEGVILGFAFGPLGALIAAMMPTQSRPVPALNRSAQGGAVKVRRGRPLGKEWVPDYPEEAPREAAEAIEADILGVLRDVREKGKG
jgi:hypothetical protein